MACTDDRRDLSLSQKVMGAPPRLRFLLVVEDLRAAEQPGVLFELRLGWDKTGRHAPGYLLGTLNFYSAQRPGVADRARTVSYDAQRRSGHGRLGTTGCRPCPDHHAPDSPDLRFTVRHRTDSPDRAIAGSAARPAPLIPRGRVRFTAPPR